MRELADWPWWRIAQVVFALTLLSEVGGGKIVVAGPTTCTVNAPTIGMA